MIILDNVSKRYQTRDKSWFTAVEPTHLEIKDGEIFGLMGYSGAGKSTLLRLINLLERPDSGKVVIGGQDLMALNGAQLRDARQKIGMVFQQFNLLSNRTVADNVAFPLEISGWPSEKIQQRVAECLEIVGLSERAGHYPAQLSGGQKQRVGIARALIMRPRLIIADECISALDVSIQAQVVNLMKDIQQKTGCAYLFIAHDLSMVKYISDRIGVLHLGHLVETGTKDEIFTNPIHPYTKSLLSAIPHPNPEAEKSRKAMSYDYRAFGVDYNKGTEHLVNGTHFVLATDGEYTEWTKDA